MANLTKTFIPNVFPIDHRAPQTHGHMSVQFKGAPPGHIPNVHAAIPNAYGAQAGGPQGVSQVHTIPIEYQKTT